MLALAFTFPAGRYHATPWDRHVNEGAVAWPPEPWRILRALVATWHHKVKHEGMHREQTLQQLIASLAEQLPEYTLPAASHSHTRHYMPQFAAEKTSLVLDAFAAIAKDDPLTVTWPDVALSSDETALLDDLLAVMGYLGRAESWVEARRIDDPPAPNCRPGEDAVDAQTGEIAGELIALTAPLSTAQYHAVRGRFLVDKKAARKLADTLPADLLSALSVDTAALRKQGWSRPPAAQQANYIRPLHALRPVRSVQQAAPRAATTIQFLLVGKPLPRLEDALRIGELFRAAVMSEAKRRLGPDRVPSVLSGHDLPEGNRHGHAFYLPWDSDGDGRIDRLLVHVPIGMDGVQCRIVEGLGRLWSRDGGNEWRLVLEGSGQACGGELTATATRWCSVTPYLHPWHAKKRFSVEDQIRRECRERGLPEPIGLERVPAVPVGPRQRQPIHFHRQRSRRGQRQADTLGSLWHMTFPEPVTGPLALGFACHFGMGVFLPSPTTAGLA